MAVLLAKCGKASTVGVRLAYDGRGNAVIRRKEDVEMAVEALGGLDSDLYAEQWVPFKKELAVIVAR